MKSLLAVLWRRDEERRRVGDYIVEHIGGLAIG